LNFFRRALSKEYMKNKKLYIVTWDDAWSGAAWRSNVEIDHSPVKVVSVGFLNKQDKTGISLFSRSDENGMSGNITFIPKGMIVKVQTVNIKV